MLTCKKLIEVSSHALDEPISLRQKVDMTIHLIICKMCRKYVQQIKLSNELVSRSDTMPNPSVEQINTIVEKIKQQK